jgi:hypothetical protein
MPCPAESLAFETCFEARVHTLMILRFLFWSREGSSSRLNQTVFRTRFGLKAETNLRGLRGGGMPDSESTGPLDCQLSQPKHFVRGRPQHRGLPSVSTDSRWKLKRELLTVTSPTRDCSIVQREKGIPRQRAATTLPRIARPFPATQAWGTIA